MTYLVPKHFKAPNPEAAELQKVRGISALGDDMDVKFFPHLFPTGTGGWQDQFGSFSQYARRRLLGLDPRFESSAAYIMWLLEMHTKKRLTGNINVRIGGQPASHGKTKYQEGRSQIFTALRDIPGTHPYVYAKKQVAMNMYEQLGTPKFFMTLSCNARQPDILIAAISARLLRLHPCHPPEELERQAAQILFQYQNDETFTWDGLSPNQLCNQHPAIVARQFMHQLTQLMWWLSAERDGESHLNKEADPQDEPQRQACGEDDEDFVQAPTHRTVQAGTAECARNVRLSRPWTTSSGLNGKRGATRTPTFYSGSQSGSHQSDRPGAKTKRRPRTFRKTKTRRKATRPQSKSQIGQTRRPWRTSSPSVPRTGVTNTSAPNPHLPGGNLPKFRAVIRN